MRKKSRLSHCFLLSLSFIVFHYGCFAQEALVGNIRGRTVTSLNGQWQYIIDPYETGFYNYRFAERDEKDREAYWNTDKPDNKSDRREHGYTVKNSLRVPGDWNSQNDTLLYYEGTIWYKRSFDFKKKNNENRVFLYFGAVNYKADVYLNGKKLGSHKGGFTAFNFEIPGAVLREKDNFLVVKVDNRRYKDEVPTLNTDWWNYGGITRDVWLAELPPVFVQDYAIRIKGDTGNHIEGWIKFNAPSIHTTTISIPELNWKLQLDAGSDSIPFEANLTGLKRWTPETPQLYRVNIVTGSETIADKIGFRSIAVKGDAILLNGKPLFLRGISLHEEIPSEGRRAYSASDAKQLLLQARSVSANMVRLAHYPHNEYMTRTADSLGLLVWSEIPVYWTIEFTNAEVLQKARQQLREMIARDHNRASIIIWSVGNETPVSEARTAFMKNLLDEARSLDGSRLVAAALEVHSENGVSVVDDPLGAYTDLVAVNEYLGWYNGLPNTIRNAKWDIRYNKPLFFSETGAETLSGFHGDSLTRWSEEYQEYYYREQVAMMKRMPPSFSGLSPWILNDFRSPKRNNPVYQRGWNNKGLLDHKGKPKKAFYVLKAYYEEMKKKTR